MRREVLMYLTFIFRDFSSPSEALLSQKSSANGKLEPNTTHNNSIDAIEREK